MLVFVAFKKSDPIGVGAPHRLQHADAQKKLIKGIFFKKSRLKEAEDFAVRDRSVYCVH